MKKTYTIQVACANCDFKGDIELLKGTLSSGLHECPNCLCRTANKVNAVSSLPVIRDNKEWPWHPPRIWTEPDRTWIGESEPVYPFKVTFERKLGSTPCSG